MNNTNFLKKLSLIGILLIIFAHHLQGQIFDGITYQAVALDEKGKEIAGKDLNGRILHSKQINVKFSILDESVDGPLLYQEVHPTFTDHNGLFSVVIGQGESTYNGANETINDIAWNNGKKFLKVEIDIKNSDDYKIMGIQQMMGVPFAYHSITADRVTGINDADSTNEIQTLTMSNDTIYLSDGGFVRLPPTIIDFNELKNIPSGLSDGDDDTQLTEAEVDAYVENNGYLKGETDPVYNASEAVNITDAGSGMVISNAERAKLASIADNAEVNVQSDWNQTDIAADDYILNKPVIYFNLTDLNNDAGFITNPDDADADPSNEIQILSISNDTIFLSDGGFVKLPKAVVDFHEIVNIPVGLDDGDDDTQLTEAEVIAYVTNNGFITTEVDGSVTNELQNLAEVLTIGNLANSQIKNLSDPTDPQDAATKTYVDSILATGDTPGQMMYWDGSAWIPIEPGEKGQQLTYCDGYPIWGPCPYALVLNTAPAEGGMASGAGNFREGEEVTVSAVPSGGYGFMYWQEGVNILSSEADYSFSMPGNDLSITAHFGTEVIETRTYTSSGTIDIPIACFEIEYLIVAGGGSGGAAWSDNNGFSYSGGGGGGGMLEGIIENPAPGTYNVVVGAGGASSGLAGNNGGNSSFYSLTAIGGGGGGYGIRSLGGNAYINGKNGGSGGGAGGTASVNGTRGTGIVGQGYNGGNRVGGGGGAGGDGSSASTGGNGGVGRASTISGSSVLYGPGGRGGTGAAGSGSNYGRGGNGTRSYNGTANGGAGSAGIIILKLKYYE